MAKASGDLSLMSAVSWSQAGKEENMRKISAMYEWSGGTDYRHVCKECPNCILVKAGKRTVHKCLSYGNTEYPATDWNPAHIACKAFGKTPPVIPVYKTKLKAPMVSSDTRSSANGQDDQLEGQMNIFDFIQMEE